MSTKQLATRVDVEQERRFRENTRRLGTTPADAMRMFVAAFNECQGFPFEIRVGALRSIEPFASEQEATEFATRMAKKTARASR